MSKLELDNHDKVPAGYGINDIAAYGKKFLHDAVVSGEAGAHTHKLRFYGYNTQNFPDSFPDIERKDIKQFYYDIYAKAQVYSARPDSNSFDYSLSLRGDYFHDYFKNSEPHVGADISLSAPLKGFRVGVDGEMDYYALNDSIGVSRESLVNVHPFVEKKKEEWEIKLGLNSFVENTDSTIFRLYPQASIKFQVIGKALILLIGVDGYVEENNYRKIVGMNPYVLPGTKSENTQHKFIAYGGFEGQLISKAGYRLDVTFDQQENNFFFANDTLSALQNHFMLIHDDADLIKYHGEVYWSPLSYLTFFARANYYDYSTVATKYPWQKPKADFSFSTHYNFKEKIYADLDFITMGKRYAWNWANPDQPIQLDPVLDVDLMLGYHYSNALDAFVNVYNLASQKYYLWNQYPSQRINVLVGVTYKF